MKAVSVCATFAILSLWMPLGALHASSGALFALLKLTDGVYVHYGQHVGLDHDAREDSANLGVVVGQRCIAVIDTGGSVKTGAAFRKVIEAQFMLPVCFVINTHVHFDHVLGNAAFQQPGVTFTGHQALAEVLLEAYHRRRDIGELTTLRRYERWRKGDNLAMLVFTDMLKRLFASSMAPIARARNLGLGLVNAATPLKLVLMRRAAGLAGDLPRLARPRH